MNIFICVICAARGTAINNLIRLPLGVTPLVLIAKDEEAALSETRKRVNEKYPQGSEFNLIQTYVFPCSENYEQELVRLAETRLNYSSDNSDELSTEIIG